MKKRVISMLLAAIMAVFAVGCGNNQDVAENVVDEDVTEVSDHVQEEDAVEDMEGIPENVTITFWNAWVGSDGDTLTELVHQFNEENEYGITVDMTITSSVNEMLQSSLPTGDAADLILGDTGCINRYVGYLRPIDDIFVSTGLKKMEVFPEYKAAMISLTREELKRYDYHKGDSEGLVNVPLGIEGIRFSTFFREDKEYIKVSMRSKGFFPVNKVAAEHFNGGGHLNAAGGEFHGTMEEAQALLRSILPLYDKYMVKDKD